MEEYDDDVISSELILLLVRAVLVVLVVLVGVGMLVGGGMFIATGSFHGLLAALLLGNAAARMLE